MALTEVTGKNFGSEVLKADSPVIVDFWAEWCHPCLQLAPVYKELSEELGQELKFAKLDTEAAPELAGQHGVMSIPTMIIFNRGEEVDRITGFYPKPALKEKIKSALKQMR